MDVGAHYNLIDGDAANVDSAILTYAANLKNGDGSDKYADQDAVIADWENVVVSYFSTQNAPNYNAGASTWAETYAAGFAIVATNIEAIRTYYVDHPTNSANFESALLAAWFNGTDSNLNAIKAVDIKSENDNIVSVQ